MRISDWSSDVCSSDLLPMFHCNGWCFPWTVTALAGTHVCLRQVRARAIYDAIADHGVSHLCGAPIVMPMLLNAGADQRRDFGPPVKFMTAAAPPPRPEAPRGGKGGVSTCETCW